MKITMFYPEYLTKPEKSSLLIHIFMPTLNPARKQVKSTTIKKHQIHNDDSGSPEVQIAVLTKDIDALVTHLKANHKDHSSRRGLLKKVGLRKSQLRYLQTNEPKRYQKVLLANKLDR